MALKNVFAKPERATLIFLFFVLTFSFANIYGTFACLAYRFMVFPICRMVLCFGIIGLTSAIVQGGLIGRISKVVSKEKYSEVRIILYNGCSCTYSIWRIHF